MFLQACCGRHVVVQWTLKQHVRGGIQVCHMDLSCSKTLQNPQEAVSAAAFRRLVSFQAQTQN